MRINEINWEENASYGDEDGIIWEVGETTLIHEGIDITDLLSLRHILALDFVKVGGK